MTIKKVPKERELELFKEIGKNGLIITTLFTREEVAYIANKTLKKEDEDLFKIYKKIYEFGEKIKGCLNNKEIEDILLQIEELMKEVDRDKINRELLEYSIELAYTMFEGKHYEKIKDAILSKLENKRAIYNNLEQLFSAYENELYYPCICGAIPIIERIIRNSDDLSDTKLTRLFKKIAINTNTDDDFETELLIANLKGFIQQISVYEEFSKEEPIGINRHWILHGRSIHESSKVDCLKVFIAIYSLMDLLGDEFSV